MAITEIEPQGYPENTSESGYHPPELTLVIGSHAVEQTVGVIPDCSVMEVEEFKLHIQRLAESGGLDALLEVDSSLVSRQREVTHVMAELTVEISELSHELNGIAEKERWVRGYIKDRL